MAPKEKAAAETSSTAAASDGEPVAAMAKDLNALRLLARYAHKANVTIEASILQDIGGLARSTAYALLKKAKDAEGITESPTPKKASTAARSATPKETSKTETKKRKLGQETPKNPAEESPAAAKKARLDSSKAAKSAAIVESAEDEEAEAAEEILA